MDFISVFGAIWLTASFINVGYLSGTNSEALKEEKVKPGVYVTVFFGGPFILGRLVVLSQSA
jgi:hypothetical protein